MDCCGDYDNNVEITNAIATFNPISFDGITINAFQEGAFVCIDNLGTTDESNVFWFAINQQYGSDQLIHQEI